jgi:hypothetical protein
MTEAGFWSSFTGLPCPPFGSQFEKIHDSLKLLVIFDFRHGSCNMRVITAGDGENTAGKFRPTHQGEQGETKYENYE